VDASCPRLSRRLDRPDRGNNGDDALFAKLIWISFIKKDTAMPLRKCTAASLLAFVIAAPFTVAQAQTAAPAISMEQARRIATENGVVRIEEIELDDGSWEIEGRDAAGAEIELDLRASDGMIIKIERDRPAAASARP
jgi:hypothetical protein